MDHWTILVVPFFVLLCTYVLTSICRKPARLPPGPHSFPIIGNILQLGHNPHESLANLSKTYGPLISLRLGQLATIVVSSPEMAKQVLQKHDQALSSRTIPDSGRAADHAKVSVVWLPADSKWRSLRRICKDQLFAAQPLDATQDLRHKKVQEMLDYVRQCSEIGEAVNIGRVAFTTTLNLLSNTVFSIDLTGHRSDSSQEFKDIIREGNKQLGKPNLSDFFPVLRFIDPQGLRRIAKFYMEKIFAIHEKIIRQRIQSRASSAASSKLNDVLEALLDISQKNHAELSYEDIKHFLLDIFAAGTDTSSITVEWAMAELLHNPEKMRKARNELEQVLGRDYIIQEADISRLPYIQAVVKETLRLHPPVPLLIPRKADSDVEINGYIVPKNAQVLINVWAIGRDSSIWPNPNSFVPERFLESQIDFKGHNFAFIPFGAGRRVCPGMPLGDRMVHLMLAYLLKSFDWKFEEGVSTENMNMDEKFGLTLHKAMSLKAIPIRV